MTDDDPMDLRALRLDDARYQALVARIEAAAAPALARRSLAAGVEQTLARAVWPALIAAAAGLLLAVGLGRTAGRTADVALATTGIESVLPGTASTATWIEEQRAPTDDDLAQAIGLGATE